MDLPRRRQKQRITKALQHPSVNILGHPTGRQINRRRPVDVDLDEIFECARKANVAVELNAQPDRLDLRDTQIRRARELGLKVVISTDAHRVDELELISYGVDQAQRAWLSAGDVLNTLPAEDLLETLQKYASGHKVVISQHISQGPARLELRAQPHCRRRAVPASLPRRLAKGSRGSWSSGRPIQSRSRHL